MWKGREFHYIAGVCQNEKGWQWGGLDKGVSVQERKAYAGCSLYFVVRHLQCKSQRRRVATNFNPIPLPLLHLSTPPQSFYIYFPSPTFPRWFSPNSSFHTLAFLPLTYLNLSTSFYPEGLTYSTLPFLQSNSCKFLHTLSVPKGVIVKLITKVYKSVNHSFLEHIIKGHGRLAR